MYDLKLIPIYQEKGQPIAQLPGLFAASAPRRAARSRSEDLLVLSLRINSNADASLKFQDFWLEKLVDSFFKTGGSVTSALRALIETLNLAMMEKNLKSAKAGSAISGAINLAALHRQAVYIAQSGLIHAYVLNRSGLVHFYDAGQTDRGLGFSRIPTVRYYQADLDAEGYLFTTTDTPAATWTQEQLCKEGLPSLDQLRRRLLNQSSPNLRLDLVQILPGEGQISTLSQPVSIPEDVVKEQSVFADFGTIQPDETTLAEKSIEESEFGETQKLLLSEETEITQAPKIEESVKSPAVEEESQAEEPEVNFQDQLSAENSQQLEDKSHQSREAFTEQVEEIRKKSLKGLAFFVNWWGKVRQNFVKFFQAKFSKGDSSAEAGQSALSLRTSLLIAIIVPLVVVAIAVGMFLTRGRSQQYQYYLAQAEMAIASAQAAEDPEQVRLGYSQAIQFLDQAEALRSTEEAAELRASTQKFLDHLDGAVRLSYHTAIVGSLYEEINITRIISFGRDLYMLDATGGRVIHATRGSKGYEIDPDFVCRAGSFSGGMVDLLVDITSLPINNPYQAHVLAADAVGNVVFCGPGQDPLVQVLPYSNETIGSITRIASEGSLLYVLDSSAGSVWVYRSTNGQFLDEPTSYFKNAEAGEKPTISQIVDIAVNGADLYLLHEDGKLTYCVASGLPGDPVNCENPVEYVDSRPGKEDQPVTMPASRFASILYTAPPNPAVNILDADNADIFQFSLRFRLNQRMRSDFTNYELASPTATAFTIGVDRIAFIAFGHQVFWAYLE